MRTLRVVVVAGPDQGTATVADSERVTVGTAHGNDLMLSDPTVSGYHLELVRLEDGIRVVDLGSTNGTRLASARVERAVVVPGTVLELGRTQLRVGEGETTLVELHGADSFGGLRGRTPEMRRLMARLQKLALTDAEVLLIGESGTGKELIARALHEHGPRSSAPFVTVDCGALVPSLAASELFGHERGAFTSADRQQRGAFERAHGGTLFLDEVGELPTELQSHLLGVLDRRRFRRVGGQQELEVDVRVLSATNRDLRAEVNRGAFRLDLYYRLAVVCLEVPPLRERPHDIVLLVQHFLAELGHHGPIEQIVPEPVLERMLAHHWPGNVRELRNLVEASLATGEAARVVTDAPAGMPDAKARAPSQRTEPGADPEDSTATVLEPLVGLPYREARDRLIEHFQAHYLRRLLDKTRGNVSQAAREAQMDRSHLIDLLRRHKLR